MTNFYVDFGLVYDYYLYASRVVFVIDLLKYAAGFQIIDIGAILPHPIIFVYKMLFSTV